MEESAKHCTVPALYSPGERDKARKDLAPLRYQPGRLLPPGEALRVAVEEANGHSFFLVSFFMFCGCSII